MPIADVAAKTTLWIVAMAAGMAGMDAAAQAPPVDGVSVFAAGSLRAALGDAARDFEAAHPGVTLRFTYGASGLLKDRLMAGERADVFASANMDHPEELHRAGKAGPVQRFARNAMCALVRAGLDVTSANLVERMLDPAIRLGTSTPVADPSGDYAWQLFERVERSGVPDASRRLAAKALQLTDGPASPPPLAGRNVYASLVAGGSADIFITYCTNAASAVREEPALRTVNMPDAIDVGASYGIASLAGESTGARAFVEFLLGQQGQRILAGHGFAPR